MRKRKNSFLLDNRRNHFNKALSLEPDDPSIRYHRGYCEEMRGDWELARKHYEAATKRLHRLLTKLGDRESASKALTEFESLMKLYVGRRLSRAS